MAEIDGPARQEVGRWSTRGEARGGLAAIGDAFDGERECTVYVEIKTVWSASPTPPHETR